MIRGCHSRLLLASVLVLEVGLGQVCCRHVQPGASYELTVLQVSQATSLVLLPGAAESVCAYVGYVGAAVVLAQSCLV